ncbi:hypothetical protein [Holdemanella porci]|uniref:hypothetical protein n=1 Tax=Holdemanella porci TaxID=2652276 RepID=UPI0022DF7546|nr:hypothetical protein [Holdemanella porci]
MNAREMFKSLGYKRHESENGIQYYSESGVEITFIFLIRRFYKQENFQSLNISVDEFKAIQQQMKELGWIAKEEKQETNYEHYKDEIIEGWMLDLALVDGKLKRCSRVDCDECEFNPGANKGCKQRLIEWVKKPYEKPKYKLTQFEFDLLQSYSDIHSFNTFNSLSGMKEKGYFKGIDDNETIGDILDNCEVID